MLLLLTVLLLGVAHTLPVDSGNPSGNLTHLRSNLVAHGMPAAPGDFPYMGFIAHPLDYAGSCAAVLVSTTHALTHRSCGHIFTTGFPIRFNLTRSDQTSGIHVGWIKEIQRLSIVEDPEARDAYDLLLLTLKEEVHYDLVLKIADIKFGTVNGVVKPLDNRKNQPITVGYGKSNDSVPYMTLNYRRGNFLDDAICKRWEHYSPLAGICVGSVTEGDLLKLGDGGGALVDSMRRQHKKYSEGYSNVLIGIAAHTPGTDTGFYVRVARYCPLLQGATNQKIQCFPYNF
uniref:Peptidase S1 domain-containing protein n=1 Tax=Steinernema glaseri TaxID=37863 RepID=A0A1I7ZYJ0_9BILA